MTKRDRATLMDVERERRWNELLVAALDVEPARREALLAELEPEDEALVEEVLASLADDEALAGFLERPKELILPSGDGEASSAFLPPSVPGYRVRQRIGSGGMGEVYRAEQQEPVRRQVALKCIQAHLPVAAQARFLSEREALARLNHRCIARFFDAGTTQDGRPWLAMELLDALPVTEYCDAKRLSLDDRLRLFLDICSGLEHAHRRQILHRDLKPSNVLVIEEDGALAPKKAVPKIIDFGIAKLLDASPELQTRATQAGALGTPAYMSPEALVGSRVVDTRTDVYSLGVLLYELLVGRRPFDADSPALGELVRRVREDEPADPGTSFRGLAEEEQAALARRRDTTASGLVRAVDSDLRWVLGRALEKDPDLRYGSVRELADDLQRILDDQPIEARPPSTLYRFRKLVRRRKGAVIAASIALFGLAVGAVGSTLGFLRARAEARSAQESLLEAREVSGFLVDLFEGADPTAENGNDLSVRELLDRGADEIRDRLRDHPEARGRLLQTLADVYLERGSYDRAEEMLREAAALLDAALPEGDPDRASVHSSLGVLHVRRGEWAEAELGFAQAVAVYDAEAEPEKTALARHNLGVAVYRQGRLDEAEEHFRAALDLRRDALPPDHPHLARSYNALGAMMLSRKRPIDAEEFLLSAVEHRERTLGPDHPDLAKALVNLARSLTWQGRLTEARQHLERAVRIEETALGPEHPDLAKTLNSLAEVLSDLGDLGSAEAAWRRVVDIHRSAGVRGVLLAWDLEMLARLLFETGQIDEAEMHYLEAAEISQQVTNSYDPGATIPRLGLASVSWKRGQLDLAEREARVVLALRQAPDGRRWWIPGGSLRVLAGIAHDRGDAEEAAALAEEVLEMWRQKPPKETWWTRRVRAELESYGVEPEPAGPESDG